MLIPTAAFVLPNLSEIMKLEFRRGHLPRYDMLCETMSPFSFASKSHTHVLYMYHFDHFIAAFGLGEV